MMDRNIKFSVIMPTYNQCSYIRRAILSLFRQTYNKWELIIVNDGCTDETEEYINDILSDQRVSYLRNEKNMGLGYSINQGIKASRYEYIAYLPSDDYYYDNHLECLAMTYNKNADISFVYSGIKIDSSDSLHSVKDVESRTCITGFVPQLVQVSHIKNDNKWTERSEFESCDLFELYWKKLLSSGIFATTNIITTFWTQHPFQRYKLMSDKFGGNINKVRSHYKIDVPIIFKPNCDETINEIEKYKQFRGSVDSNNNGLKILIVGELSYNPERILAFEEAGHKLFGLWIPNPQMPLSHTGPLPFGHVVTIDYQNWMDEIYRVKPDIIYGITNWESIGLAYEVLKAFPHIPFAWHYKEGPHYAISIGAWEKLIYLYSHASIRIFINETIKKWYEQFISPIEHSLIIDADLPKKEYFKEDYSKKLSELDGEIHTVCSGRLIGLSNQELRELASNGIHIHLYTNNYASSLREYYTVYNGNNRFFHLHEYCDAANWVKEFSKYDAAWLHCYQSNNQGDLMKASWDDLNIPARLSTYMAAGLPVIEKENEGNIIAISNYTKKMGVGIRYVSVDNLKAQLENKEKMQQLKENVLKCRHRFYFDNYIPMIIREFKKVISENNERISE